MEKYCPSISIGNKNIGCEFPPFIIAEMSGNHNQSLERALDIVAAAAQTGVDAIKLQTYTADTLTLNVTDNEFRIDDSNSLWNGKSLYDLYKQAHTPWEWHKPIMEKACKLGLICFSTPFDETAVDFLESIDVPAYKIASFENNHLSLIRKVAATGKPLILSTGMASLAELDEAVGTAKENGCNDLILLKCTSTYPASPKNSNVMTIPHMKELFGCEVGLSDHTLGLGASVAAIALGATVVEKHFTLCRDDGGVDCAFSLEPQEMSQLARETKTAWQALGKIKYGPGSSEMKSLIFKRSLYISHNVMTGEKLTEFNLRCVRPGLGIAPKFYDLVLGKRVNNDLKKGTALAWDHLLDST